MTQTKTLDITTRGDREIVMIRGFHAPKRLVWDALTTPELLKQWLGVRGGWTLDVCEIDLRPGGTFRYVWRKASVEMGMSGVYREIVPDERIVSTELFDTPWYPGGAVSTAELVEDGDWTTLTTVTRYASQEARDDVFSSRMAEGVSEGYEMLDKLLVDLAERGVGPSLACPRGAPAAKGSGRQNERAPHVK